MVGKTNPLFGGSWAIPSVEQFKDAHGDTHCLGKTKQTRDEEWFSSEREESDNNNNNERYICLAWRDSIICYYCGCLCGEEALGRKNESNQELD